ncbi:MAG: hypothetical protein ICV62_00135 [Cyanobacteria bacterium Co-bin13]|nr:hypothetical protein [Cyanobacteria bacterium Co-bin13]
MRRFLPTGMQVKALASGGGSLMGAIAGLLSTYRNLKFGLFERTGGTDLSADRSRQHRRSEQCSSFPVLQLG